MEGKIPTHIDTYSNYQHQCAIIRGTLPLDNNTQRPTALEAPLTPPRNAGLEFRLFYTALNQGEKGEAQQNKLTLRKQTPGRSQLQKKTVGETMRV